MEHHNSSISLDKFRKRIAARVRELRRTRRWTQEELSRRLGLSQSRFSQIERGDGSFTAEQFLTLLELFNVGASHFAPPTAIEERDLQNSLARLGGFHLRESPDVLPSERLEEVNAVVREVLLGAESPRLLTALAPVIVRNADRISLRKLHRQLIESGAEHRLGWLIENTLEALRHDLPHAAEKTRGPSASWVRRYRHADVVLSTFLEFLAERAPSHAKSPLDVLDRDIRTRKTRDEVIGARSPISERWGIVTGLQSDDFARALQEARVAH